MPRRTTQHDWEEFHAAATRRVEKITREHLAGKTTAEQYAQKFEKYLNDRHTHAAYLGRRRAGNYDPKNVRDKEFGALQADTQRPYMEGFLHDIGAGKYVKDGELNADAIYKRAGMYADALLGTANESFIGAAEVDDLIDWRLGAAEEHCAVCPQREAESPYKAADLPGFPGDGSTPCLVCCKCFLVRKSDGLQGFKPAGVN